MIKPSRNATVCVKMARAVVAWDDFWQSTIRKVLFPGGVRTISDSILPQNCTLNLLGPRLDRVLSLAIHISPNNGTINMVSVAKWIYYILPLHIACLIIQIGPLVAKLQHVTDLRGG